MKKTLSLVLAGLLLVCALPALAAEKTSLPLGLTFDMGWDEVAATACEEASLEPWEDDLGDGIIGSISVDDVNIGVGSLKADSVFLDVNRNNSALTPRLYDIICNLPTGDNVIQSFRDALEQVTSVYGEPDSDPFDEGGVEAYVEYGSLYATWTRDDTRISLNMQRMYGDSLSLDFANRLCYSADDLK